MRKFSMRQWGAILLVIGVGSFILPMIGFQFRVLNLFGEAQPIVGLIAAVVGGALLMGDSIKVRKILADKGVSPSPRQQIAKPGVRCSTCGGDNSPRDQFCGSCGAMLARGAPPSALSCVRCGAMASPDERFCGECGAPLERAPAAQKVTLQTEASTPIVAPTATAKAAPKRRRWLNAAAMLGIVVLAGVGFWWYLWEKGSKSFLVRQAGDASDAKVGTSIFPQIGKGEPSTSQMTITNPMYDGYRLDWCHTWGTDCGEQAAMAWCKSKGYAAATNWVQEVDVGARGFVTKIIGSGQLCDAPFCDSFNSITCSSSGVATPTGKAGTVPLPPPLGPWRPSNR